MKDMCLKKSLELPEYFRPTKEWDLIVVKNGNLIVAVEAKSQVGPSFGNNFKNRTEEDRGSLKLSLNLLGLLTCEDMNYFVGS